MRGRLPGMLLCTLMVGCASRPALDEGMVGRHSIGQQLLAPESNGGSAGEVQPYVLAPTETFRMPEPLHAPPPELPAGYEVQTLPATTVCVRVIIDAAGDVVRTEPLLNHSHCADGEEAANAPLLQAALAAPMRWSFRPAALCHFPAGQRAASPGNCEGAKVEEVAVTLAYAFTFEVEYGRASVRGSAPLH